MKARIAACRDLGSCARKIAEGCAVANVYAASGDSINCPRWRRMLNALPSSALAAVAPRQTRISGCTASNSASNQGRQASISDCRGFL